MESYWLLKISYGLGIIGIYSYEFNIYHSFLLLVQAVQLSPYETNLRIF